MMDSGRPGGGGGVMVGRMLSCSIETEARRTLPFSVWVAVGLVFFPSLFPLKISSNKTLVFFGYSIIMESCFREKARFPKFRLSTKLV